MKRSCLVLVLALAMLGVACGGGDDDDEGSASAGGDSPAETDFPPPTLTSGEVCEMIGTNDVVAIFEGVSAASLPLTTNTGCMYSVFDGENTAGEATITLLNNGARPGYEARVEFWSSRRTVTPIPDFDGAAYQGDAVLVEGGSGPVAIVMYLGGNWVWEVNSGATGDAAITERLARAFAAQV
ncbi:MAG: hypothetical protein RIE08_10545 [Acidimicrobiales bacterium]